MKRGIYKMIYDAAIVGSGPAGVSAALNLKIHQKNFIWLGSRQLSDKITKAEKISNYPGFFEVTGRELNQAFREQIDKMGIEIQESMVNSIMSFGSQFALMAGSDFFEAKTVILTTGVAVRAMFPNENELLGRGVSYCATCDGGLYRNKTIAVVCGKKRFEHEVKYLAELAGTLHFFPQYPDADPIADNVILHSDKMKGIIGEDRVQGVLLTAGEELAVDGVFILRDSISLSKLLEGLAVEDNHIVVNRRMETSIPGIFAAGDCTGRPYQYTKAVGEGNVAAHSVLDYLAKAEKA
jgi:thioredoxin reductase (NADPH)